MFSCQFHAKRVSVRERKSLPETITYIAITETVTCTAAIETVVHNVLQKIPPI